MDSLGKRVNKTLLKHSEYKYKFPLLFVTKDSAQKNVNLKKIISRKKCFLPLEFVWLLPLQSRSKKAAKKVIQKSCTFNAADIDRRNTFNIKYIRQGFSTFFAARHPLVIFSGIPSYYNRSKQQIKKGLKVKKIISGGIARQTTSVPRHPS